MILNIFFDLSWIPEIDDGTNESLRWVLTIISKMSSSIGLALILGNLTKLFNKKDEDERNHKKEEEQKSLIQDLFNRIEDTIVSKVFLQSLSDEEKKKIIASLLSPKNDSLNKHSNIKEYFNTKSNNYLNFFNINFRSHMNIDVSVYQDSQDKFFYAKFKIKYRIYKINNKYEPVAVHFDKEFKELNTIIKDNNGKKLKPISFNELIKKGETYFYNIPNEYNEYNFLSIELTVTEKGHKHWITVHWQSLTPIDGLNLSINCCNGIVKEYKIFDNNENYSKPNLENERTLFTIESSKWLDPYTGLSVLVANQAPDDDFN